MKHIPIMLALALSISLTSYDGTTTGSENISITEETTITMEAAEVNEEEMDKFKIS